MLLHSICALVLLSVALYGQPVEVVKVRSQQIERITKLQGELLPYQRVALHARVTGYVEKVMVDRGTVVSKGQLLANSPHRRSRFKSRRPRLKHRVL